MDTSNELTRHENEVADDDVFEIHAHDETLTCEDPSSLRKVEVGIGLTAREEAEVQEIILKAEQEFYNDNGNCNKSPRSAKRKLVDGRNSLTSISGLLVNQHDDNYSNYVQDEGKRNNEFEKGILRNERTQELKETSKHVGANIKQITQIDSETSESFKIDRTAELSKEDKAIMLDLVDIALGKKEISEANLANASDTNEQTREDIIKEFVKAHFKTLDSQYKSQLKNENENRNFQSKLVTNTTNIVDENITYGVTNPPPSTPEKVLAPVSEEDEIVCPIGLTSAEEKEINEIIQLAERAYKGKIDTAKEISKLENVLKHVKCNMKYATVDTAKEVTVDGPSTSNKKEITTSTENTEAMKTHRKSTVHFFIEESKNQDGEVENIVSEDINGNRDEGHEEDVDNFSRGMPMNDKNGRFFINRSMFPVSEYQEGLSKKRWNPTAVLNELCAKLDWLPLEFGRLEYRPDQGFKVPVTVRGQEFITSQWGYTKKSAKHLASAHFLKYLGFRFNYHDTSKYDDIETFGNCRNGYVDLDAEGYQSNRNTADVFNDRESCDDKHYLSRSRRSGRDYERVRRPDPKKSRSEEFSFSLTSRSSIVHRESKSIDRYDSLKKRDSPDIRDSLNIKNTLESLNLKDILKLKDSAVIVINNFERAQGSCRRRRHSTSSSSPSPRERSGPKHVGDAPRTASNVFRRPARWENIDDIKPFVPRNLDQDNTEMSPRRLQPDRLLHPRQVAPRPHRCRCKPSFPHPSIHPWRTELKSSKYSSPETPRAHVASDRRHCSYGDLERW